MDSIRKLCATSALLILCLLRVPYSLGADANGNYRVLASDYVKNCAALNVAVDSAQDHDNWSLLYGFSVYTMGYITAVNRLAFDTYDVAAGKNPKNLLLWLENYCEANPGKSIDEALHELVSAMYPGRLVAPP